MSASAFISVDDLTEAQLSILRKMQTDELIPIFVDSENGMSRELREAFWAIGEANGEPRPSIIDVNALVEADLIELDFDDEFEEYGWWYQLTDSGESLLSE